jgi:NADH:ubiquinone oxidoreductase subunit F (NADH-binding)
MDIIDKLKEADLKGRGGGGFPTGLKWEAVKKAKGDKKYVVCNGSEGEPNVFKDGYILENYPEDLIKGIDIAMKEVGAFSAYLYLNKDYYEKYKDGLEKIIGNRPIILFKKMAGYIGGEESAACELIEGRPAQPRRKPPFLSEVGLFGCPTLMNNIETFYYASKINEGKYEKTRLYSINGDVDNPGVYELSESLTAEEVLRKTDNYPSFDFFAQIGGGASGEIVLPEELNKPVSGAGSITVYNKEKTDVYDLMEKWADFFHNGNCDKCLPCREGSFRVYEIIKSRNIDYDVLRPLFDSLRDTSFCPLGRSIPTPFVGLIEKVIKRNGENKI